MPPFGWHQMASSGVIQSARGAGGASRQAYPCRPAPVWGPCVLAMAGLDLASRRILHDVIILVQFFIYLS